MAGCRNRHPVKVRLYVFDTADVRVMPKSVAERLVYHKLALPVEEFEELKAQGGTVKVKILRNGKVCDMPTQNAEAYIKTGQAVAVDVAGKALEAPVSDKKMKSPPAKKMVGSFVCKKCGKTYKTARGLANHNCK